MNNIALECLLISGLLLTTACTAEKDASRLAAITSAHLQSLNGQMQQYVATTNDSRKNDALRLASLQTYYRSIDDIALSQVRAWKAYPEDPGNKNKVAAFDALQSDAQSDLANSESDLQQKNDALATLEASYGQLTYNPSTITGIITQLQALSKGSTAVPQIELLYTFSSEVLRDAKTGLATSQLNPNGVAAGTRTPSVTTPAPKH